MSKRPHRILVADDEEQIRFLWRSALLKPPGAYEVATASDGCEAMEIVTRAPVDLVVTDVCMPGMDGVALTASIRQMGYTMPVIWITAFAAPNLTERARCLDVYCCLSKPLRVAKIRRVVAEALAATGRGTAS